MEEISAAYRLEKAREREHILVAIDRAVQAWPTAVAAIAAAADEDAAREWLRAEFDLDPTQAQAILDTQLRRLTAERRAQIHDELVQFQNHISELLAQVSSGIGGSDVT